MHESVRTVGNSSVQVWFQADFERVRLPSQQGATKAWFCECACLQE